MTGLLTLDHRHPTPLYAQIERGIRAAIANGRLAPGDQLPTVRELAVDLKVNANTIARVYLELERAGVLQTRRGVGTFVGAAPRRRRAQARPARPGAARARAALPGRSVGARVFGRRRAAAIEAIDSQTGRLAWRLH